MKIDIIIGTHIRTFEGDSDTLQNKNWDEIVYTFIEDTLDNDKAIKNM